MSDVTDLDIIERDGHRCVRCGKTSGLHVHHRWPRSAGTDERSCNKISLCFACHGWVHDHPRLARIAGWIVPRAGNPATAPVKHEGQGGFVLLDSDYGFAPWPPEGSHTDDS